MEQLHDLLDKAYFSPRFHAVYDAKSYETNQALSERQLFTQSNTRVLLGQDTMGRLHFVAAPHERDYALPTMNMDSENHITACPGMYYQTDLTLFLGKISYTLHTTDGMQYPCAVQTSVTAYADHFLPVTSTAFPGISMRTVSLSPLLEQPGRRTMKTLPLPGPSGAIYGLILKNTGSTTLTGTVMLHFHNAFMSKYEHCNIPVEERAYPCTHSEIDRHLLLMQRPEGYTGIHMKSGNFISKGDFYEGARQISIAPGQELVIETYVCVSEKSDGISEALSILYQHSLQEWIRITGDFWRKKLGVLTVTSSLDASLAAASADLHIRSILDNFNCIQTDETGRVLIHCQGAPSHCFGRMWGIDVEPTALSFLHLLPELSLRILEYMLERNEPRYSPYKEHSVPIMMAPLILAGSYYAYTADTVYFNTHPEVAAKLNEIYDQITGFCKEGYCLVPSRYSSDGIVMRRYDHGTNVKFWYACTLYSSLCQGLGQTERAAAIQSFAQALKKDLLAVMIADGPFGPQITGGTNLGEQENFYMDETFFYYDGEDSSSVLSPVYGIYSFDFEPWVNYHRFARSLFASNYDPEMGALRWFPYGGAVDGTAFLSQLGGVTDKEEMLLSLQNLLSGAVDDTGSVYWWPKGENMRRMISRCSQGQGSFNLQYLKQWLGISYDAPSARLEVSPLGLLDGYQFTGAVFGDDMFDITYREEKEQSSLTVTNRSEKQVTVVFGCRPYGAGAQCPVLKNSMVLAPMDSNTLTAYAGIYEGGAYDIPSVEAETYGDSDGILFHHFGFEQPCRESSETKDNIFLLRFVLVNGGLAPLNNISVDVTYPALFRMQSKQFRIWDQVCQLSCNQVHQTLLPLAPGCRSVAAFWVEADKSYHAEKVWFDSHPFLLEKGGRDGSLIIEADEILPDCEIHVRLRYELQGKEMEKTLLIPVKAKTPDAFHEYARTFLGALSE